jgi:hypothetical protein
MFQQARKSLYNMRDPDIGRLFPIQSRAGPECKLPEEMSPEELRLYLSNVSGEAFGGSIKGKWLYLTKGGTFAGGPLAFAFASQQGVAGVQLQEAGMNYYNFVIEHGAPILGFINTNETFELEGNEDQEEQNLEAHVTFSFEGRMINIRIPELRRGMRLDDPTVWGFNADHPDEGSDVSDSTLVTMRILGLCRTVNEIPHYRMKLRIPARLADQWDGKRSYLGPEITYRHINCSSGAVTETTRSDKDIDMLKRGLERFIDNVDREDFTPRQASCDSCQYNTIDASGKIFCDEAKKGRKPSAPAFYFRKRSYEIAADETPGNGNGRNGNGTEENGTNGNGNGKLLAEIRLVGYVMKNRNASKQVNEMAISLRKDDGLITAESAYSSQAYGLGLEDRMLEELDDRLQEIADDTGLQVVHSVEFTRDFKFAGQKKVLETLAELGYRGFKKTYIPANKKK